MAPRVRELHVEPEAFLAMLALAFAQKRKTLANNLRGRYDDKVIRSALKAGGVRPDVRAEAVPLEKMAAIFRGLGAA